MGVPGQEGALVAVLHLLGLGELLRVGHDVVLHHGRLALVLLERPHPDTVREAQSREGEEERAVDSCVKGPAGDDVLDDGAGGEDGGADAVDAEDAGQGEVDLTLVVEDLEGPSDPGVGLGIVPTTHNFDI